MEVVPEWLEEPGDQNNYHKTESSRHDIDATPMNHIIAYPRLAQDHMPA